MLGAQLYVKSDGTKLSMEHHHKCRRGLGEAPAQGGRRKQRTPGHKKAYSHTHPLPHKIQHVTTRTQAEQSSSSGACTPLRIKWQQPRQIVLPHHKNLWSLCPPSRLSDLEEQQQPGGTEIGTAPIQKGNCCQGYRLEGPNCKKIFVSCFLAQF
jgi:hypothetical protein